MALAIETFSNRSGPQPFFKAAGHPLAVAPMQAMIARVAAAGPVAFYDPESHGTSLAALYDLSSWDVAGCFVQRIEDLGTSLLGLEVQPVTALAGCRAATVVVAAFDAGRAIDHIRHLVPQGAAIVSLDEARLPETMLTNPRRYLDPLNFATNLALLRDADGHHTRVVTANYWHGHGARDTWYWLRLHDAQGNELATWSEKLAAGPESFVVDSARVRERFDLPEFCGSLFMHAVNVATHEIVKYALDTWGDDPAELSCTHDANAYPSDLFGGLPAPEAGESVLLWLQNSHPCPVPAGAVGLNLMGSDDIRTWPGTIAPFGTAALDVAALFPEATWPQQLELRAGRHFVRPRYEITRKDGPRRIAHVNVERTDLAPEPLLAELGNLVGKGYILPFPVFPTATHETHVLPTPMASWQDDLPLALLVYDAAGREIARENLGRLPRRHDVTREIGALVDGALAQAHGHGELIYDFSQGGSGDGWLHGLVRIRDKTSGHAADSSFGSHLFNMPITWKSEPQSYMGKPPGLSTRLFLRLGGAERDAHCHLIYPASTTWHATSTTDLVLHAGDGAEIARTQVAIPLSGSYHFRAKQVFAAEAIAAAGENAYVLIRDTTCRLFGYHGLIADNGAFSLDHMFGF